MTDQPTDHRALARVYLTDAAAATGENDPERANEPDDPIALALIGIGHALLAPSPDLYAAHEHERVDISSPNLPGSRQVCTICGDRQETR